MRHVLIAAAAMSCLVLAGCTDSDDASESGESSPTADQASSTPAPDESVAASLDIESACDLLGVVDVEDAADGLGWGVISEEPARCVYQDPDATHTVTLTITSIAAYDGAAGDGIDSGASGMIAVPGDGSHSAVWAPAGAHGAVVVSQDPALLPPAAMISLTESAAIAFENAVAPSGAGDDTDAEAPAGGADIDTLTAGLESVAIEGSIPATGNTIEILVTAQRVADEGAPAFTNIACVGGSGDSQGGGAYAVLAMDGSATDGLRLAQIEATDAVQGAGTYGAAVEFVEADGDSFTLDGTMTIDEGFDSGSFDVEDRSGAQVLGTWSCVFAG
jgi:hypothetical protein